MISKGSCRMCRREPYFILGLLGNHEHFYKRIFTMMLRELVVMIDANNQVRI